MKFIKILNSKLKRVVRVDKVKDYIADNLTQAEPKRYIVISEKEYLSLLPAKKKTKTTDAQPYVEK